MNGPDGAEVAVVTAGRTPGRGEPSHRSELVTEWLCGETLEVLEAREAADGERWLRARGPDGYRSWVAAGGLLIGSASRLGGWRGAATARSLGVVLERPGDAPPEGSEGGPLPRRLPWGARVEESPDGGVRLPDGRVARPVEERRIVGAAERGERFPPRGESILETAEGWLGVPYLWGGRTRAGADCSGFVQAVYGAHGVELPRDSGRQATSLPVVEEAVASPEARRAGDLLFFGDGAEAVTHVAVSAGGTRIVHAAAGIGWTGWDDLDGGSDVARGLRDRLVAVGRFSLR